ncbi:dihydrolipoyl dehydrogenase, apicoplast [Hepatocystis sp. ex Piliocolobus tephrosceles]|uniref:dihydrolipoyl dehydrogenase n=1 Tax=Piliocolobus tephrosceles TaxID=591936 RepID=A0A8C9LH85_9PRIM|nr:dihydrolipoyl dehydrogenase, apicoplast [Hepatocystis sp. ex Piliocolobus tephrosceles]
MQKLIRKYGLIIIYLFYILLRVPCNSLKFVHNNKSYILNKNRELIDNSLFLNNYSNNIILLKKNKKIKKNRHNILGYFKNGVNVSYVPVHSNNIKSYLKSNNNGPLKFIKQNEYTQSTEDVKRNVKMYAQEDMQHNKNIYDVAILGCGVGGHFAAINAMERNLKVLIFAGSEKAIGGTCVNVGCIPSKALLYATNKYRELKNLSKVYNYGIYSNMFLGKNGTNKDGGNKDGNDRIYSNQSVADSIQIDIEKLKEYTSSVVNKLRNGITSGLKGSRFIKNSEPVHVKYEEGYIIDKNTIKSKQTGDIYKVRNIIIATGSTPNIPENVELDKRTVFTSNEAVNLEGFKEYMSIIGMGIIGLEFADIYTALGSEITFFEYSPEFLSMLDKDVSKYYEKVFLKNKPIDYYLDTKVKYIKAAKNNKPVTIGYIENFNKNKIRNNGIDNKQKEQEKKDKEKEQEEKQEVKEKFVDSCLVATGRRPLTENLGLEELQVKLNRGYVQVNEQLRVIKENKQTNTSASSDTSSTEENVYDNIFCIGDANGKQMLAHTASHQALKVIDLIEKKEKNKINDAATNYLNQSIIYRNIPSVCYTNPELAFVGYSQKEAEQIFGVENISADISYYKSNSKIVSENNISIHPDINNMYNKRQYNTIDNTQGMLKIIYNKNTKQLLGCVIVGNYASILIHQAVLAINAKLTVYDLTYMVHSHPTVSEVYDNVFKNVAKVRTH